MNYYKGRSDENSTNYENSIDKSLRRLCKKWDKIGESPPPDTYDCLMCGENFPMMPFSAIPLWDEKAEKYQARGNLCKHCFIEVDQFIQRKQKEYEIK